MALFIKRKASSFASVTRENLFLKFKSFTLRLPGTRSLSRKMLVRWHDFYIAAETNLFMKNKYMAGYLLPWGIFISVLGSCKGKPSQDANTDTVAVAPA